MNAASKGEATAPQKYIPRIMQRDEPETISDQLAEVATLPKAPFTMYHRVESRNGYWYAIRTILDSTGRTIARDESHELQRGAATEVCRNDMDRVACDLWQARYGIEGQAEILRRDSLALRKIAREHMDKCAPIEQRVRALQEVLKSAKKSAKDKPSLAEAAGKVYYDGKLVDAADVPKHRSWMATAPQTREADEQRLPTLQKQIDDEKAKLDQLLAVAAESEKQADLLSIQAKEKAEKAVAAGDTVILKQKGRRLM